MMPFALKGIPLPRSMKKSNKIINFVFLAVNIAFPLAEGILITITCHNYFNDGALYNKFLDASIIGKIFADAIALPSGVFLGYAFI
jgi:hypothetical protein